MLYHFNSVDLLQVLSGCENGNMLLWDGGLIKVEISRKGRKSCHNGPIQQIIMDEGELMSVGIDGCIRVCHREDNSSNYLLRFTTFISIARCGILTPLIQQTQLTSQECLRWSL